MILASYILLLENLKIYDQMNVMDCLSAAYVKIEALGASPSQGSYTAIFVSKHESDIHAMF